MLIGLWLGNPHSSSRAAHGKNHYHRYRGGKQSGLGTLWNCFSRTALKLALVFTMIGIFLIAYAL